MPTPDFSTFFSAAFEDGRKPYDYQRRLAKSACESRLINIPTGLGKTAAVIRVADMRTSAAETNQHASKS